MSGYIITIEDAGGSRMSTEVTASELLGVDARDRLEDACEVLIACFLHGTDVAFALRPGELFTDSGYIDREPLL